MTRSTNSTTVTAKEVKAGLEEKARTLTAEEEKVLRSRHGAGVSKGAPLERAAGNNEELADELLLMEMQLLKAMRERGKAPKGTAKAAAPRVATTAANQTKEKIVRAPRKKPAR